MTTAGLEKSGRDCRGCGAELPLAFLLCPSCKTIVHADELRAHAAEAQKALEQGDNARALSLSRTMVDLLPPGSLQHAKVLERVRELSALVPVSAQAAAPETSAAVARKSRTGAAKWVAGVGAVGVLLLKFKWVIVFVLSKAKVLLLGLTQAKTFFSMAIAAGVYTLAFGWWFALGLVLSIYVHEMGHVVWLRRYGIAATAPMFIPGLGAFVRLKQYPATVAEDARVGLAGPIWGAGAAIFALAVGKFYDSAIFLAIAHVGAWINLFNLLPVWQLDGGRGFSALSRVQRGVVAAVLWGLALFGFDGLLFVLAIAATFRAASAAGAPKVGDRGVFLTFVALIVGLTLLLTQGPALEQ